MVTYEIPVRNISISVPLTGGSRQTCIFHVFSRVFTCFPDLCFRKISMASAVRHCRAVNWSLAANLDQSDDFNLSRHTRGAAAVVQSNHYEFTKVTKLD